ncbi:hypothetical protein YC2023_065401 [Brassica napus]
MLNLVLLLLKLLLTSQFTLSFELPEPLLEKGVHLSCQLGNSSKEMAPRVQVNTVVVFFSKNVDEERRAEPPQSHMQFRLRPRKIRILL